MNTNGRILIGKISGCFGVKGWLKVFSYSNPRENIVSYNNWIIDNKLFESIQAKKQGKLIVAKLVGIDDKDAAQAMIGQKIEIEKQQLAQLDDGHYYWHDLEGLEVSNTNGIAFGQLESVLETGANDVIFVKGERTRVIPYILDTVILKVDLEQKTMLVDWHEDD